MLSEKAILTADTLASVRRIGSFKVWNTAFAARPFNKIDVGNALGSGGLGIGGSG